MNINKQQNQNDNTNTELERIETSEVLGTSSIPTDISIVEASINILDINADEPIINGFKLELTDEVYKYIHTHVTKCFNNDKLKFGKFNPQIKGFEQTTKEFLKGNISMMDTSEELSRSLFSLMKSSDGVNSCDLMTVYMVTNIGPMVGVLKLDYLNNFVHNVDYADEKILIGITPVRIGLPSNSQKVTKAAFVTANQCFDLFYIDDAKKNSDENINFWKNNFLNCEEVLDAKNSTKNLFKAAETWTRGIKFNSVSEAEAVRSSVRDLMRDEEMSAISITDLAETIFPHDTEKNESFRDYLISTGLPEEVDIDKPTVLKKFSKVKIQTDSGITMNIDVDDYNDPQKFAIIQNGDGSVNMVIKNITNYIEK